MKHSLLVLFAFAGSLFGQTVKLPAEVKVQPGRLAAVTVEWDGDSMDYASPPDLDVFREYDPDPKKVRLRLIGYAAGKHTLFVAVAKGGKVGIATCSVVVGTPVPPVPPGPVPPGPDPPVPPLPTDPLTLAIRDALAKETAPNKVASGQKLAELYNAASEQVKTSDKARVQEFFAGMSDAAKALIGEQIPLVRRAIADWLKAQGVPNTVAAPLTPELKISLSKHFAAITQSLRSCCP